MVRSDGGLIRSVFVLGKRRLSIFQQILKESRTQEEREKRGKEKVRTSGLDTCGSFLQISGVSAALEPPMCLSGGRT